MTFGENLKSLRSARALSQKELAEVLGFSFQNISKWERNESLPDIATLLSIAKFFETTTDALLGYAPRATFSMLKIDSGDVQVYTAYPETEETVTGRLIFAIDCEGKIAATVFVPPMRAYRGGYVRGDAEVLDECSTIIYECAYTFRHERIVERKRVRIPDGGFLLSVSDAAYAAKQIMQFVIPEEHGAYLDRDTHAGYYNSRSGHFLFSDILRRNELDHITVELTADGVLFKKPEETVDPMAVNIQTLAKIVRKELQREHNRQIEDMKRRLDEVAELASDNEDSVDDLEDRISDLEQQLTDLREQLGAREEE